MGDTTEFGKEMRAIMSERFALFQEQRKRWSASRKGCQHYILVKVSEPKDMTFHNCTNGGHPWRRGWVKRRCGDVRLKCNYNLCPFLRQQIGYPKDKKGNSVR